MNISKNQLREFGIVFAIGMILIFGLGIPLLANKPVPIWLSILTLPVAFIALVLPIILKPFYILWMKIGAVLGWINTRIILGFIYFVVFMPVGLCMSIFAKDPMQRRFEKDRVSYRINRTPSPAKNMERPY
ncbi:MAG: sxtJ [Methyloprofundus sp.]|nr:sxtJ [Methyloprofundus sp.]